MANPLKILTHLSASEAAEFSKAVTFKSQVTMSNAKIVGLAAGTANGDAIRYEQLTAEESVRAAADSSLTSRLSVEESNSLAAVSSETSSRISGDSSLSTRVSSEESTRASADTSLTTRIAGEESARSSAVTSATTSIDARVSTEVSTRASADTSLTSRVSTEESVRASADTAEASVRVSADTSLSTRLSAEESASLSVDASLSGRITDEASIRASADGSLAVAFASADTSLSTRLANEESTRGSADASISTAFGLADSSLTTRLSTEEVARASADTSIVTSLSTESSTRASADVSLSTRLSSEESARAAEDLLFLKLDGSRAMAGALNMGGFDITSAKSGSFSGNVTVAGNLTVQGALTYLESTNTQVKDNQIELNYAATPVSNADAGIVIKGSAANNDVKLLVDADGGNLVVNTKVSASSFDAAGNVDVGGALVVDGQASVGAELMISGASFGAGVDGMFGYSNGKYSVDSAIRTLTGRGDGNIETYAALRHVNEVNLTGGSLNYALPQTAQFASSQLGKIMVDVLVGSAAAGWTNDLIAVKLETTGSYLRAVIDAPAHNDGAVRIIAVNEGMGLE